MAIAVKRLPFLVSIETLHSVSLKKSCITSKGCLSPNSAVESKVVSEEQTFRSEDNAFSASEQRTIIVAVHNYVKPMRRHAKRQKKL
jgi:hypothetical protein